MKRQWQYERVPLEILMFSMTSFGVVSLRCVSQSENGTTRPPWFLASVQSKMITNINVPRQMIVETLECNNVVNNISNQFQRSRTSFDLLCYTAERLLKVVSRSRRNNFQLDKKSRRVHGIHACHRSDAWFGRSNQKCNMRKSQVWFSWTCLKQWTKSLKRKSSSSLYLRTKDPGYQKFQTIAHRNHFDDA